MAIFITLTDGSTTKYLTNISTGHIYNDQFYAPGITYVTSIVLGGDYHVEMEATTFKVRYEHVNQWSDADSRQLTASLIVADGRNDEISITDLRAIRYEKGQEYEYQLIVPRDNQNLLTAAPDIKSAPADPDTYNNNRFYPRLFGLCKHEPGFVLETSTAKYYSAGNLLQAYSRGQTQTATTATDKTFTLAAAIDPITIDSENASQAAGSVSGNDVERWFDQYDNRVSSGLNTTGQITQIVKGSNLPTTGMATGLNVTQNYLGYYSGSWKVYVKNDGDFYFGGDSEHYISWDGTNLLTNGINVTANGTNSTATRLTINGGIAPSSGLTGSTRLTFTPTEDGQFHAYKWNGSNGWTNLASIGISTVGIDDVVIHAQSGGTEVPIKVSASSGTGIISTSDSNNAILAATDTGSSAVYVLNQSSTAGIGVEAYCTGSGATIALYGSGGSAGTGVKGQGYIGGYFDGTYPLMLGAKTSDPAAGSGGEMYYNSSTGKFRGYNAVAAAWQDLN